ncbi:RecQ family ATP-dependent DNA helicase [Cyanobacterium sp. Dongsha4]|uniref:RecQ family ATP-dependent DNA helicase n=1 Tax=Cyanobacterium sp. DS4 TaxID=2878255 RepID=UPI002E81EE15|nr:RecQ family ATP-dependent DNA helicase [Cyanobacterium sp. Dongsha4]WVL01656.1 RecQ family ATP-dependent DNA helicase [Cyanobacterium sp. Dongsha4]
MNNSLQFLKYNLQKYWGYDDFRYPQKEIINSLLSGKDCLVVMPTGGGKSLCFQLPALLQKGLTIVISPLVALMENQVLELRQKNLPASILHSEMKKRDRTFTLNLLENQKLRLLYLSPETLLSPPIWKIISHPNLIINALILDEAHCLSQWGDSFRPTYLRLGAIRSSLIKSKLNSPQMGMKKESIILPIAAFTATADNNTQKIIQEYLQLSNPEKFLISPYRDNLQIKIKTIWTPKSRKKQLINHIKNKKKQSGLIYVRTRKDSENISHLLNELGYQNKAYHGGLEASIRRNIEQDWLEEKIKFVVCTSAFGMGINKPNLRWIFHYQAPVFLSEYIQEIGRGGRDGKLAEVITLISEKTGLFNPEDKNIKKYFLQRQIKQYQEAINIIKKLPFQGNIENLSRDKQVYLSILNLSKQLYWLDPFNYQINLKNPQENIKYLIQKQKKLVKLTEEYMRTKKCRWGFLLNAFGFLQGRDFRCGKCDNCEASIRNNFK